MKAGDKNLPRSKWLGRKMREHACGECSHFAMRSIRLPIRTGRGEVMEAKCPSDQHLPVFHPQKRSLQRERRRAACAPPHPLQNDMTSTSLVMLCLSESRCLAPIQICAAFAARSREAALRQAKIISKLLLCALLSSAKLTAAGAF